MGEDAYAETRAGFEHSEASRHLEALAHFETAERLFHAIGDEANAANCAVLIGGALAALDRHREALARVETARAWFVASGPAWAVAHCDRVIGTELGILGRDEEALASLKAARAWFEANGREREAAGIDHDMGVSLARLGRRDEALARYEAPAGWFAANGTTREGADAEHRTGVALTELGCPREALSHLEEASTKYDNLRDLDKVTECEGLMGVLLQELGHPEQALGRFQTARRHYEAKGATAQMAMCDLAAGGVLLQVGRLDDALASMDAARQYYDDHGPTDEAAASNHDVANVLAELGRAEEALARYQAARAWCLEAGGRDRQIAECDRDIGSMLFKLNRPGQALERFRAARVWFEAEGLPGEAADCEEDIANALSKLRGEFGGSRDEEALAHLEAARARYVANGLYDDAAWSDLSIGMLFYNLGRSDKSLACFEAARGFFEAHGSHIGLAICDHQLAVVLQDMGRLRDALPAAVRAAAGFDAGRYSLCRSELRHSWSIRTARALAMALRLAQDAGESALIAELVETARAQGLPAVAEGDLQARQALQMDPASDLRPIGEDEAPALTFNAADASHSAALAAAGLAPLTPPPKLSLFEGRQGELAVRAPGIPREGQVFLSRVAQAAAGDEWWWWGSWATGGSLYWSLVGHDGTVEAGAVRLAYLAWPLSRLWAALPQRRAGETRGEEEHVARALAGALTDRKAEAALARDLGAALIPVPLRERLVAADPAHPLSLVVAPAPLLGRVPFALLGLDDGEDPVRLGERAMLRLGASVALLESVAARPAREISGKVTAVIDPGGPRLFDEKDEDRLHEWLKELHPETVLSRPEHLRMLHGAGFVASKATKEALAALLSSGRADVFAYVGHAGSGVQDVPAYAHLKLLDGQLTAADWLYGAARYPAPARVALLACSSGGAHSTEWLGLAPAALWAGARVVVATAWDLLNTREPDSTLPPLLLAGEVVGVLRGLGDPAIALRDLFRKHLRRWRAGDGPDPLLGGWGALQVVGLR